jgi:hypothetical protein
MPAITNATITKITQENVLIGYYCAFGSTTLLEHY